MYFKGNTSELGAMRQKGKELVFGAGGSYGRARSILDGGSVVRM